MLKEHRYNKGRNYCSSSLATKITFNQFISFYNVAKEKWHIEDNVWDGYALFYSTTGKWHKQEDIIRILFSYQDWKKFDQVKDKLFFYDKGLQMLADSVKEDIKAHTKENEEILLSLKDELNKKDL